jgi:hypothetical protein
MKPEKILHNLDYLLLLKKYLGFPQLTSNVVAFSVFTIRPIPVQITTAREYYFSPNSLGRNVSFVGFIFFSHLYAH